ncbi:hypothetical protein L7F22_031818 [Adiantum nelumboides]|nr:hypothetical protein [Adiantum nelumboides]
MGPLPRTANGKLYILVAIDYMTRFGTPLEIVSDNGPGFRRGLLTEVCDKLKISHRHSTPYYPQSNGLVEKANGIIAGIIRKMVESKPKRWDNFLDGAIWAYRTTYRDATQFTPFHLVYGQEALQPIELNIPTIKLTGLWLIPAADGSIKTQRCGASVPTPGSWQSKDMMSKFLDYLHEEVQDKVELDDPRSYDEALALANGRTKKLLKK